MLRKQIQPYIPPVINKPAIQQTEPNKESVATLFMAVLEGSFSKIKKITSDKNISLNVKNDEGESLIHAVLNNNSSGMKEDQKLELIYELIGGGASIGAHDKKNITPLHLACKYQYPQIVELLLRNGAGTNEKDNLNMTPIHYAAQGAIDACKKRKKIKNLIPKPLTSKSRDISTQELRNLTINIIDIYNAENNFNQYLKHINKTFKKIGEIYKFEFEEKEMEFVREIANIIGDKSKTQFEKEELVKTSIINLVESLRGISEGQLKESLKPMDIGPHNIQGWGPETDITSVKYFDKVLPKKSPELIKEQNESKFKASVNQVFKKITDHKNKLEKNITDLVNKSNSIYKNIHKIIQVNRAAERNRKIENDQRNTSNFFISWNKLRQLILQQDNEPIKFYEINGGTFVPNNNNYFSDFEPNNEDTVPKLVRGTKADIESWKNRKEYGRPLYITDDTVHGDPAIAFPDYVNNVDNKVGPNPHAYNQGNRIRYFPDPVYHANDSRFFKNEGIYRDKPFYYVSKYIFGIQQFWKHQCIIKYNFETLNDHMNKKYFKEAYHKIMSNILLSCYNIFQNMLLCKNEIINIQSVTYEIINEYKGRFELFMSHPYSYLLEYCQTFAEDIIKNVDETYSDMQTIYTNCTQLINDMNEIIDLLNMYSGNTFQSAFLENSFTTERLGDYDGIYDNPIKNFTAPPSSLDDYINVFGIFGNDIDLMRKEFYLNYAPYIDITYYINYISKLQPLAGNNMPIRLDIIESSRGVDYQICMYPDLLKTILSEPRNIIIPTAGYLVSGYYHINDIGNPNDLNISNPTVINSIQMDGDIGLRNKGYGVSLENGILVPKQNPNGNILLNQADNSKIGEIGVINLRNQQLPQIKSSGALPSIKSVLDDHLYIVKYLLIQKLLDVFNDPTKNDETNRPIIPGNDMRNKISGVKNNMIDSLKMNFMIEKQTNPILFTILGKSADELINVQIRRAIYSGINKYVKNFIKNNEIVGDYSEIFRQYIGGIEKQLVYKTDTGFEIGLHKLYNDMIERFYKQPNPHDFNTLMQTANVMEDEEKILPQYQIYNTDYHSTQDIKEKLCYKIEPNIIDLLVKNKGRINERDSSGSSPLFYALEIMHPELIKKLLDNNANINIDSIKNNNGLTPYEYIINLYKQHNGILIKDAMDVKEVIDKFTSVHYSEVKEALEANENYKNNIIKYLDIVFPQLIVMYNNLLCSYAKSYIGTWSYDKQKQLEEMFINMGLISNIDSKLPLLEGFKQNLIRSSIKLDALTDKMKEQDKDIIDNTNKNNEIKGMISNLLKRRDELNIKSMPHDQFTTAEIQSLNDKIGNLRNQIRPLRTSTNDLRRDKTSLDTVISNKSQSMYNKIITRINNFAVSDKYLGANSVAYNNVFREVSKVYNDIFSFIIKNTPLVGQISHTGFEDYFLYNKMWKNDISNKDKLRSIFNIHLLASLSQRQLINSGQIIHYDGQLELLKDLYNNIFVMNINNMTDLPQNWDPEENYMLTEVLDIIVHIVKHVMCSNLYYAIIKVITKFIAELNPKTYESSKKLLRIYRSSGENHSLFVREVVNRIIDPNYDVAGRLPDAKLYKYILNEAPELLVKLKLDIYKDDIEKTGSLKSEDDIFNNIINILTTENDVFTIPKDSSLVTNLKSYVFPYYKDLFSLTIPRMKSIIDNYSRYMINESRFIDVMLMMNNQARKELK